MRVAIISIYVDFLRKGEKSRGVLQPGIGPVIAGLLPRNIEVDVINETVRDIDWSKNYDLVFISCLHPDFDRARQISHFFRRRGAKTVFGNILASTYPELCAPYFDAITVGDAEGTVPAIWEDFCRGKLHDLYVSNGYSNSGNITPRFDLIRKDVILPIAFEATKGCPHHCNFCSLTGMGTRFKMRSPVDVVRQIQQGQAALRRFSVRSCFQRRIVTFLDNNLAGSLNYVRDLCAELKKLGIFWGASMTFNAAQDTDLIRLMASSGCLAIFCGLESFNQVALDDMEKPQNDLSHFRQAIDDCRTHGILLSSGLILDSRADTCAYVKTIPEKLREVGLHVPTFIGFETAIPGTPLFETLAAEASPALLPNVLLRDITGYTLVVKPKHESVVDYVAGYRWLLDNVYTLEAVRDKLFSDIPVLVKGGGLRGLTVGFGELAWFLLKYKTQCSDPLRTYIGGTDIPPPEMYDIPFSRSDFNSEAECHAICNPWPVTDADGYVLPQWREAQHPYVKK